MSKKFVRAFALVLVVLMCLSLLPLAARADEVQHVCVFEPTTIPPTCGTSGYVQMICPVCGNGGEILSWISPTGEHHFESIVNDDYLIEDSDNLCVKPALYWKSCVNFVDENGTVCGAAAEEAHTEALNKLFEELNQRKNNGEQHTDAEWQKITEDAVKEIDAAYTFTVGGEGHNWVSYERQEATCVNDGWEAYRQCADCGAIDGEYPVIPAKGHRWGEFTVTKEPTCTEDGSKERVCEVCGEKETVVIPAPGHKWGAFTVTKAATCTVDGEQEHTCTVCNVKETEVIPAGHKWGEWVVTVEPGCYSAGEKEHTCTVCKEKETEVIPAAHKFGEWVVTMEPTCYSTGEERHTCTVCGETESRWIDMAHKYVDGVCVFCGEAAPAVSGEEANTEPEENKPEENTENTDETEIPAGGIETAEEPADAPYEGIKNADATKNGEVVDEAYVGNVLTAAVTPANHEYVYQWYRIAGEEIEEIPGAYGKSYKLTEEDLGASVYCYVDDEEGSTESTYAVAVLPADQDPNPAPAEEAKDSVELFEAESFGAGPGPFTVEFNTNGGSGSIPKVTKNKGATMTLPAVGVVTKAGHSLVGWNTKANGTGVHYDPGSEYIFYDDVVLYAEWDIRITYNPNGGVAQGTPMASTAVPFGADNIKLAKNTYVKINYTFMGWTKTADGSGEIYEDEAQITAPTMDTDLYAQWAKDSVWVSFDKNSGNGSMDPVPVDWGNTLNLPLNNNQITNEAYSFKGWNTKNDGTGRHFEDGATIDAYTFTKDTVLYAEWSKTIYTVTFNKNNGDGTMDSQTIDTSTQTSLTLRKNTFTRTDHSFTGWNTEADGSGTSYKDEEVIAKDKFTRNLILYAQWKNDVVTVQFDANRGSGTGSGSMPDKSVNTKTETTLHLDKNTFTKTGYQFTGWNLKSNGSGKSYKDGADVPTSVLTENPTTFYAQWKQTTFTVTYYANTGSGTMAPQTIDTTDPAQTSLTLTPNAFTKVKHVFVGWNTEDDGTGADYANGQEIQATDFTEDLNLYAQWETAIVFDGNGATSGSMTPQPITIKDPPETVTLKANAFSLTNYTFDKWTEKKDGSGQSWADQGDYVANTSRTLYAQWVKTSFSVSYDKNGGGGTEMTPTIIETGSTDTVKECSYNPPDTSKIFGEWQAVPVDEDGTPITAPVKDADGNQIKSTYDPGDEIRAFYINGDKNTDPVNIVMKAQWKNKLAVWFNPGEGTGTAKSETIPQNTKVKLPTPESLGFAAPANKSFAGWIIDGDPVLHKAGEEVSFDSAKTVTAQWADTITITFYANNSNVSFVDSKGNPITSWTQKAAKDVDTVLKTVPSKKYLSGYEFMGWDKSASATPDTVDYPADADYPNPPITAAGGFSSDVSLFAVWKKHDFTGVVSISGNVSFANSIGYVGETLTAEVTGEKAYTEDQYKYQWKADGNPIGEPIVGEAGKTLLVRPEYFEKTITCTVTVDAAPGVDEKTSINSKYIFIDTSERRVINEGQIEKDYVEGITEDMTYSINNGEKQPVTLITVGGIELFEVTKSGIYRFYKGNVLVGSVEVVNWWTIGYTVETQTTTSSSSSSSSGSGSGTVTLKVTYNGQEKQLGNTSSTSTSDPFPGIVERYSSIGNYDYVWIVREGSGVKLILTVKPSNGSYAHVSLNGGAYSSTSKEFSDTRNVDTYLMYYIIFNKSSTSPRTADESHLGLWSALCFTSLVGASAILTSSRKRRKNED